MGHRGTNQMELNGEVSNIEKNVRDFDICLHLIEISFNWLSSKVKSKNIAFAWSITDFCQVLKLKIFPVNVNVRKQTPATAHFGRHAQLAF